MWHRDGFNLYTGGLMKYKGRFYGCPCNTIKLTETQLLTNWGCLWN